MEVFSFLKQLLETDDSKILFVLSLICGAMITEVCKQKLRETVE